MSLVTLADSAGIHALGWTLLHFVWQGCLIAALLALALALVPRAAAPARYAACCVALAAMLFAPLGTLMRQLGDEPAPALMLSRPELAAPAHSGLLLLALSLSWALGSLVMSLRLVVGVVRLRRWVERALPVPAEWQERLVALARGIGLARSVRLVASAAIDTPLTLGWLRPLVVLPIGVIGSLPAAYVEALLLHELAHVRRLDYLVNVLQTGAEALLFYHPAVHWVSRRLRLEREHCCDDVAIGALHDPIAYARALTAMEAWRAPVPLPALGSNGGSLLGRIERIVGRTERPRATRASALLSALVAACGLAMATAWACAGREEVAAPEPVANVGPRLEARPPGVAWFPPALER
ncbi:MAG TPA: M56 family metallopeptidase, partial [Polyangiaceae bacterium]|nr:M56 family metallopeptidase [Polyangiaceae bacterium]